MTPNEIYAAKSIHEEDWRRTDAETIQMVFGVTGFGYRFFDGGNPVDASRLVFARKADYSSDDESSSNITTVSFDGRPFAVLKIEMDGSSEDIDATVTDEKVFRAAREHVVSFILDADHGHTVASADADIVKGTKSGFLVKVADQVRLANPYDCRWSDGTLVFDTEALAAAYRQVFAHDGERLRKNGLADREMRSKALEVFAAAVVPGFTVLKVDSITPRGNWHSIAFEDGVHTHLVRVRKHILDCGSGWRAQQTMRIGPPCMLAVMECVAESRAITPDNAAVADLVQRFGLTVDIATQTLNRWALDSDHDLLEMVLEAMDADVPVDPKYGMLTEYRVPAYVAVHPEAVVYCVDGYPSQKQAVELMEAVTRSITSHARSVAAPSPR
jgi:hypothetical protein